MRNALIGLVSATALASTVAIGGCADYSSSGSGAGAPQGRQEPRACQEPEVVLAATRQPAAARSPRVVAVLQRAEAPAAPI